MLATVKGDVHDIGKNLVEIILSNNGYQVVNLGIKVPPEELIKAYSEHQPDAIGLSGPAGEVGADDGDDGAGSRRPRASRCPILVGGAALSTRFTRIKIAPEYDGPGRLRQRRDGTGSTSPTSSWIAERRASAARTRSESETRRLLASCGQVGDAPRQRAGRRASSGAPGRRDSRCRPILKLHVLRDYDLDEIFRYINPVMLYTRHLGFKNFEKALADGDPKAQGTARRGRGGRGRDARARRYHGQRGLPLFPGALRRRSHR